MRALIKPAPGPGLELTEVPEPSPGFGEVKIRVMRTGLILRLKCLTHPRL